MDLSQNISQLLYRYQCVVVPGFGGFLNDTQSAELNENTNLFFPPRKTIYFNANLVNNDGLIANHISISNKISYDDAVRYINLEVASWKETLNQNQVVSLKNIGSLSLNYENRIVFVPSNELNYLTSSFGLNSYVSPMITREILKKEATFTSESIVPEVVLLETKKQNHYLKYAAIFLITSGIGGLVGNKIYQDKVQKNRLLVEVAVQKKIESKIQEATFFISNPLSASVTINLKTDVLNYHVVAGAFKLQKNAQKRYNELISKGFSPKILTPNNHGLIPVLYGSYASYGDARTEMNRIQKTTNPDAWVLIQELKSL